MRSKIFKIGFEIEGEFHSELVRRLNDPLIGVMKSDGSVHSYHDNLLPREYNSLPLKKDSKDIDKIFGIFQKAYDNGLYNFNATAGMHIHMSFEPQRPPEILSFLFFKTFMESLKRVFPKEIRPRIGHRFCEDIRDDREVFSGNERYRAINFQPALQRHGTIEFRIFPSETPEKMKNFLLFTISQVEHFLKEDHEITFDMGLDQNQVTYQQNFTAHPNLDSFKDTICVN